MEHERDQTGNKPETNRDDYLWDSSGVPDAEIQRLEGLLGKFRHDRPAPVFPIHVPERRWRFLPEWLGARPAFAAAAVVIAMVVVTFSVSEKKVPPVGVAGWDVSSVSGTARVGKRAISGIATGRIGEGQVLETDSQSRASLKAEDVGEIEVEASTRLRVLNMGEGMKRIALDRGTIHAYIWSSPGQFVVDTPAAVTVDLGCAYTLKVDDSGAGLVRTSLGWVGFKLKTRESFIPSGAACATKPKVGPGTPYFEDASAKFREALARFDFEDSTPEQRAEDVSTILGEARKRDALTLWHLLARVDEAQRETVYERLTKLAPPPATVTKEGVLRLDQPMLDLWWNELGFDDISVWRKWERSWPAEAKPIR